MSRETFVDTFGPLYPASDLKAFLHENYDPPAVAARVADPKRETLLAFNGAALPNTTQGVFIGSTQTFGSPSNNTVGGLAANAGNRVAFNTGNGIVIGSGTRNAVLSNSVFQNGSLGIDLGFAVHGRCPLGS